MRVPDCRSTDGESTLSGCRMVRRWLPASPASMPSESRPLPRSPGPRRSRLRRCHPIVPVPILQIHGTGDWTAPYAGGPASGLRVRLFLRHRADPCVGVDDWARLWVDANGADRGPDVTTIPPDTTVRRWFGTSSASDIVFYRVAAGGHTWPGNRLWVPPLFGRTSRAFDATAVTWDFFAAHAREV